MKKDLIVALLCAPALLAAGGCAGRISKRGGAPTPQEVVQTNRLGMTDGEIDEFIKQFEKRWSQTPEEVQREWYRGLNELMRAAIEGDVEKMKSLLEAGHAVDPKQEGGETPLIFVSPGDPEIARLSFQLQKVDPSLYRSETNKRYVQCVRLLLAHGADVNHETSNGTTPLRVAIFCGQREIEGLLWHAGATNLGKRVDLGLAPRPR